MRTSTVVGVAIIVGTVVAGTVSARPLWAATVAPLTRGSGTSPFGGCSAPAFSGTS
jgi:hypothetical protein